MIKFILSIIFALAQAVLLSVATPFDCTNCNNSTNSTTNTTDSYGCFNKGELWKDLGTNQSIIKAYDEQWCTLAVGCVELYHSGNRCIRGDPINHAFIWKWQVTKIPEGKTCGYASHDVCVGFLAQVLDKCEKGGVLDLISGPGADGGDIIGATVTADPQGSFSCHS